MKKKCNFFHRYPGVAIDLKDGNIITSRCTCQQSAGGKCCHVGCLLYLVEELSMGEKPKYDEACTSKPQRWGKGTKVAKNPRPLQDADYGHKRHKCDKYYWIDPRPSHLQKTTTEELNNFVTANQFTSMKSGFRSNWDSVFEMPSYADYALSDERKTILKRLGEDFLKSLDVSHDTDILSTQSGTHLRYTMDQSDNQNWFNERKYRITASIFFGMLQMRFLTLGLLKKICFRLC